MRMDKHLQTMWHEINKAHFDGQLQPLATIDWGKTSGPEGIGAHGKFFQKSKCIVIDEKFNFDEDALHAGDKAEAAKAEVAYRLMMHEMVHQALHQKKAPDPGGHGASFLAEAQRIAQQLGEKPPAAEDLHQWPLLPP